MDYISIFIFLIGFIAYICYMDKKSLDNIGNCIMLHNYKIYLVEFKRIYNSDISSYKEYKILLISTNKINFGYLIRENHYLIDWYNYIKLKEIQYTSIFIINMSILTNIISINTL